MLATTQTQKQTTATFNSGLLVKLTENKGTITASDGPFIPFGYRTMGFKRYYTAREQGIIASEMVVIPMACDVAEADLIEVKDFYNGKSRVFRVINPQRLDDSKPPCWLLTLQETGVKYVDQRADSQRL